MHRAVVIARAGVRAQQSELRYPPPMKTTRTNRIIAASLRTTVFFLSLLLFFPISRGEGSSPLAPREENAIPENVRPRSRTECSDNAALWLVRQQRPDGSWPGEGLAPTALSVLAVMSGSGSGWGINPVFEQSVRAGCRFLLGGLHADGTFATGPGDVLGSPTALLALCQTAGPFLSDEEKSRVLIALERTAEEQIQFAAAGPEDDRIPFDGEHEERSAWNALVLYSAMTFGFDVDPVREVLAVIPGRFCLQDDQSTVSRRVFLCRYLKVFGVDVPPPHRLPAAKDICSAQTVVANGYRDDSGFVHDTGFWDMDPTRDSFSNTDNSDEARVENESLLVRRIQDTACLLLVLSADRHFRLHPPMITRHEAEQWTNERPSPDVPDASARHDESPAEPKEIRVLVTPKKKETRKQETEMP